MARLRARQGQVLSHMDQPVQPVQRCYRMGSVVILRMPSLKLLRHFFQVAALLRRWSANRIARATMLSVGLA